MNIGLILGVSSLAKKQISINLPPQAVEMLEKLVGCGLFGDNRGQVAADLILSSLKQMTVSGQIDRLIDNSDD